MPFDVNTLDSDFLLVDGVELVIFIPRDLNGVEGTPIGDLPAFREQIETAIDEGAEGWQVLDHSTRFHLYGPAMGSVIPKRGDRIVSQLSAFWEVLDAYVPPIGRWYECNVRAVS